MASKNKSPAEEDLTAIIEGKVLAGEGQGISQPESNDLDTIQPNGVAITKEESFFLKDASIQVAQATTTEAAPTTQAPATEATTTEAAPTTQAPATEATTRSRIPGSTPSSTMPEAR